MPRLLAYGGRAASAAEGMPLMPIGHAARQGGERGIALRQQRTHSPEIDGLAESHHEFFRLPRQVDGDMRDFRVTAKQDHGMRQLKQIGGNRGIQDLEDIVIFLPHQGAPLPHNVKQGGRALQRLMEPGRVRAFFYGAIPPSGGVEIDR
jgi:hypothetical protein